MEVLGWNPKRPSLILIWGWDNYTLLFQAEPWLSLKEVPFSCCGSVHTHHLSGLAFSALFVPNASQYSRTISGFQSA